MPERILLIVNGTTLYGQEKGNFEVLKAARELGWQVLVGINTQARGGDIEDYVKACGFECFYLPFHGHWSKRYLLKNPWSLVSKLKALISCSLIYWRQLRTFQPTRLLFGNWLAYSYVFPVLWFDKTPLIYRIGDAPPESSNFNARFYRALVKRAHRLVVISKYIESCVRESSGPSPTIDQIYNNSPGCQLLENQTAAKPNHVLYVGQIAEHKGCTELVLAFARLVQCFPDAHLDMVGGDVWNESYAKELKQRVADLGIANAVSWHGFQTDVMPFYAQAKVQIVPSLFEEPLSNVVMEAKCNAVPSIVFPSGGLPEVIENGVNGIVCTDKSEQSLYEAMDYCLGNPAECQQMGRAALQSFKDHYSNQRYQQQWQQVLQDL